VNIPLDAASDRFTKKGRFLLPHASPLAGTERELYHYYDQGACPSFLLFGRKALRSLHSRKRLNMIDFIFHISHLFVWLGGAYLFSFS
jgi:hypothetical protein